MAFAAFYREQLQAGLFMALMLRDARLDHEAEAAQEFIDGKPGADARQRLQAGQTLAQFVLADGGLGKELSQQRVPKQLARIGALVGGQGQQPGTGGVWCDVGGEEAAHGGLLSHEFGGNAQRVGLRRASPSAVMSNRPLASRSRSGGLAWRT
jgi:hypothetical protein